MTRSKYLTPLALGSALIIGGLACKKPQPMPPPPAASKVDPAAEAAAKAKAEADAAAKRRAEEEAGKRMAAAEEARKAEEARRAENSLRQAAEKTLVDIHFDYDKHDILGQDKKTLEAIAAFLKAYPQVKLQVEGNCDERGTIEYNLALGEKRARAAVEFLKALGVAEDRLGTISYGKEKPLCTEAVESCWHRNRRAHFSLKG